MAKRKFNAIQNIAREKNSLTIKLGISSAKCLNSKYVTLKAFLDKLLVVLTTLVTTQAYLGCAQSVKLKTVAATNDNICILRIV